MSRVLPAAQGVFDLYHIVDRNAFGDADDQFQPGVGGFQNGVGGERRRAQRWRETVAPVWRAASADRVKDRDFFARVLEESGRPCRA